MTRTLDRHNNVLENIGCSSPIWVPGVIFEECGICSFLHEQSVLLDARNVEIVGLEANSNHQLIVGEFVFLAAGAETVDT